MSGLEEVRLRLAQHEREAATRGTSDQQIQSLVTLPPKIVALAMRVLRVMVFHILLKATPCLTVKCHHPNYIPKTNLNAKD